MAKNFEILYDSDDNYDVTIDDVLLNCNVAEYFENPLNHITILQDSQEESEIKASLKLETPVIFVPKEPVGPPLRGNFAGTAKFSIEINAAHTQKKYLYSHILNRIYVDIEKNFSVNLNWDNSMFHGRPMYVRATTVFSDEAQAQERVERCYQHSHKNFNGEIIEKKVIMNVLRSAREPSSQDVYYCGDPDSRDSWYSVLVRLAAPTGHAYKFVCKSSCPAGINRRAIDIIFTLEDAAGEVHGRCSVGARVCSCPRRDIGRDERDAGGRPRKRALPPSPRAVKMRVLTAAPPTFAPAPPATAPALPAPALAPALGDTALVTLPTIQVVGIRAAVTGLSVMVSMMQQARDARAAARQPAQDLDHSIASLQQQIDRLSSHGDDAQ